MWYMVILKTLKNILLALVGEKIVAKVVFSFLEWLAEQSKTPIDNEIVQEWKNVYYGKANEPS